MTSNEGNVQTNREGVAPKEPWKNLFSGAKMASTGVELGFVTPLVKDGKKIAQLQQPELDAMADKWQATIVMYVVEESPTIASVKRL